MARLPSFPSTNAQTELLACGELLLRRPLAPYRDDAALLTDAELLFRVRVAAVEATEAAVAARLRGLARRMRTRVHRAAEGAPDLHLSAFFLARRLTGLEREIVLVLCLGALGLLEPRVCVRVDVADLQTSLGLKGREALKVPALLGPGSRLVRSGVLQVQAGELPVENGVHLDPEFLEPLVRGSTRSGSRTQGRWRVRSHEELLDHSQRLVAALADRADTIESCQRGRMGEDQLLSINRAVTRELRGLEQALSAHPEWPLARVRGTRLGLAELQILVVLVGRELGFRYDDGLSTGAGLARCVSSSITDCRHALALLRAGSPLRSLGLVRPQGGATGEVAAQDDSGVQETAFEATPEVLEQLGVKPKRKPSGAIRFPVVQMESLVLPGVVCDALDLVIAQDRHRAVLFDDWGLGETIPYGRGQTVLFGGPPGVGKTATAEALAAELGRPLYVVQASRIVNCWVGETEKAIVQAFREAKEWDAVMFWDEADGLFTNRDQAHASFEVRWINVLLQEIERYEGVCILATNRRWSLDPALERRITVKVEFPAPDAAASRAILAKLLPARLPLAKGVNLEALAVRGLTGGQLKNVVLNAARRAVTRGAGAQIEMDDLERAISAEQPPRKQRPIGFPADASRH